MPPPEDVTVRIAVTDKPDAAAPASPVSLVLPISPAAPPAPGSPAADSPGATTVRVVPAADSSGETTLSIALAENPDGPGETTVRLTPPGPGETTVRIEPSPVPPPESSGSAAAAPERPDERPGLAAVALAASVAGGVAFAVPPGHARLILLLVCLLAGPGPALLSIPRLGDRLVSWALAVCASLSIACGVALLTLWTHLWQPFATMAVVAAGTGAAAVTRLVRFRRDGHLGRRILTALLPSTLPRKPTSSWLPAAAAPVAIVAAVGLWIVSLLRTTPSSVGYLGLSAALGVPFLAAMLLLAGALGSEIFGRLRASVLSAGTAVVIVFMHASVPLLDGTIEYAWTYKHIGVIDLIRDNGHLLNNNDIYQQWPGFFAPVAIVSRVSHVDALSFAAWSSLSFALLNALLVTALIRQFTDSRRVMALGTLLFTGGMWVDIGYFSPQAFVFPLALGFWLIVIRWLMVARPQTPTVRRIGLARLKNVLTADFTPVTEPTAVQRRWAVAGATGLFAAITMSHQLSPYMIMGPLVVLVLLNVIRPRYLVLVLGVLLVAFTAPRLLSVASQYHLFDLNPVANASGNADTWRTPEQEFSALVARGLAFGLWGSAMVVIWRARRRLGTVLVPAIVGFTPFATLAGGNYGGEAIYRVFAFSLPFAALLIAQCWATMTWRPALTRPVTGLVLAAVVLSGLQGLQGQLIVHQVRKADIEAATYFYAHAVPGSALVLAAPNFPTKLAGNYNLFNERMTAVDITLIGEPSFFGHLDASRVDDVEDYVRGMQTPTGYLVINNAMSDYTDYFGMLPKGSLKSLQTALDASPDWSVFYRNDQVTIYRLLSDTQGGQ